MQDLYTENNSQNILYDQLNQQKASSLDKLSRSLSFLMAPTGITPLSKKGKILSLQNRSSTELVFLQPEKFILKFLKTPSFKCILFPKFPRTKSLAGFKFTVSVVVLSQLTPQQFTQEGTISKPEA